MPNAVLRRPLLAAACIAAVAAIAAAPSIAAEPPPGASPAPPPGPPPNMECAAEPVTGSGPGFLSSRADSEKAALEAWVKKAKAVYPEANWASAYQAGVSCAVQGLYSKCFAQAIPCKPKAGADAAQSGGADDAPKAE